MKSYCTEVEKALTSRLTHRILAHTDNMSLQYFVYHTSLYLTLLSVSKQQAVIPSQVFELGDGTCSYQDFSLTRNNRFSSAQSSRNIIQPPATVLHFYNAPPNLNQHQLQKARPHLHETYYFNGEMLDLMSTPSELSK